MTYFNVVFFWEVVFVICFVELPKSGCPSSWIFKLCSYWLTYREWAQMNFTVGICFKDWLLLFWDTLDSVNNWYLCIGDGLTIGTKEVEDVVLILIFLHIEIHEILTIFIQIDFNILYTTHLYLFLGLQFYFGRYTDQNIGKVRLNRKLYDLILIISPFLYIELIECWYSLVVCYIYWSFYVFQQQEGHWAVVHS